MREANQRFARLVRAVRRAEQVMLLDRGTPIAVVKPIVARDAFARLEAKGLLIACAKPGLLPATQPARIRGGLSKAVIEERNERG